MGSIEQKRNIEAFTLWAKMAGFSPDRKGPASSAWNGWEAARFHYLNTTKIEDGSANEA
jgi:hypothetical protein